MVWSVAASPRNLEVVGDIEAASEHSTHILEGLRAVW